MAMHDELSPNGMIALVWSFTALSVVLTIGRQTLRFATTSRFRLEDAFHGIAQALLLGFAATFTAWLRYDQAAHSKVNTLGGTQNLVNPWVRMHFQIAIGTQFWSIMGIVKFGFMVLYRSIFNISRGFMKAWWIVLVFTVVTWLMTFLSVFWICSSPKYLFDIGHCKTYKPKYGPHIILMGTSFNVASDIAVMALPLCMLRTLQMPRKQKIGLAAVFLLGLVDLAFDIIRVYHTVHVAGTGSWAIWDILEPCIAVITSALPPYKILLASSRVQRFSALKKPSPEPSQNNESTKRQSSAASDSTRRQTSDPYSKYWDDEKLDVVTSVRPVLSPSPLPSTFGEFREEDIKLNAFNEV